MEIWKNVNGTDGFIEVSNFGRVRSLLRGEPYILKQQKDEKGYLRVTVNIYGNKITYKVHRLVAIAFIENINNLPQVNHIDGNKENNTAENLEWINNKDNIHHAINSGLWEKVFLGSKKENERRKKKVIAYSDNNKIVFDSVAEAERFFNSRHISDVLKGKRKHVKGYSFEYAKGGDACAKSSNARTK